MKSKEKIKILQVSLSNFFHPNFLKVKWTYRDKFCMPTYIEDQSKFDNRKY